jgi:hypothetical protein
MAIVAECKEVTYRSAMKPWILRLELSEDRYVVVGVYGTRGSIKARFRVDKDELMKAVKEVVGNDGRNSG